MIYVKRVEIASITLNADGTADCNLIDIRVIVPLFIKKVLAIGIKPLILKTDGVNNVDATSSFELGTLSISDSYGNFIGEYFIESSYLTNMKIKTLLNKLYLEIKGGDILKLVPQFSREVIRATLNQWYPISLQNYLNGNPKVYIDVYLEY